MNMSWRKSWIGLLVFVCAVALVTGCATKPKVNWDARIGNYTFDQAVTELGPPDKQAKLGDGTTVAEWMTRRGYWHGSALGAPRAPWYSGPAYPDYVETYSPDYFLRLTFGSDGQLKTWKQFAR